MAAAMHISTGGGAYPPAEAEEGQQAVGQRHGQENPHLLHAAGEVHGVERRRALQSPAAPRGPALVRLVAGVLRLQHEPEAVVHEGAVLEPPHEDGDVLRERKAEWRGRLDSGNKWLGGRAGDEEIT